MARTRRVSVMMCRSEVTEYRAALRDDAGVAPIPLRSDLGFQAQLYAEFDRRKLPAWLELLDQGAAEAVERHPNVSNAAVLVIRRRFRGSQYRLFVITFGYGRALLDPNAYERDFGLRVALNKIDPDELVSLDVHTLQEAPFRRRVQASRAAPTGEFDLDSYRDMLTSVTGRPTDGSATRMTGGDAAAVTRQVDFDQLGALCDELAADYRRRRYQKRFGWIDHLGQVRRPEERDALDQALVEQLRARHAADLQARGSVTLAPPQIIDWARTEGFWITGVRARREKEGLLSEPDLDWYLARLKDDDAISVDKLKRDKLEAHSSVDEDDVDAWPLYRALVVQLSSRGQAHLLVNGTWFQVAATLIDEIDQYVDGLSEAQVELPAADGSEHEDEYNRRTAAANPDLYLLDRDLLPAPGPRGSIESCDLLHRDGVFVHVKRYRSGSADLSHLFAQALVSVTTFHDDPSFRAELRTKLGELGATSDGANRLAPDDQPTSDDFEIAYAVVVPPRITRPSELPFFAKLALMRTSRLIQRLGYHVTITLVASSDAPATGLDTSS